MEKVLSLLGLNFIGTVIVYSRKDNINFDAILNDLIYKKLWYVYSLDNEIGSSFYIGKGRGKRVLSHEKNAYSNDNDDFNSAKNIVIREVYVKVGYVPKRVLASFTDEKDALAYERILISNDFSLTNHTPISKNIIG